MGPWLTRRQTSWTRSASLQRDDAGQWRSERQDDVTANLMFPFRYLDSLTCPPSMVLRPGDVIATGTPNGAGARFDPPKYLRPGDVVEVEVPGVGLFCATEVAAERP